MSVKATGKRVLVCSCDNSMTVDPGRLAQALDGADISRCHSQLCRAEIDRFRAELAGDQPLLVCCTQEAPLFSEIAEELGMPEPAFVDIRDRAGWSDEGEAALPKMAALIAEAMVPIEPAPAVTLHSDGITLVYGRDEATLDVAARLAATRPVTCVLIPPAADLLPPAVRQFALFRGVLSQAKGHLGAFTVSASGLMAAAPSARGALRFDVPVNTVALAADLILDLTGGAPLFGEGGRRDGYLRADSRAPAAVERLVAEAAGLLGDFEKPRYVVVDPLRCAHSRNGKVGCTRCLDACPTSSIIPAGDHVEVDPYSCSGHGACSAVCPTEAITYALPSAKDLFERMRVLLAAYRKAGGRQPQLFIHDLDHGAHMIQALARLEHGLPASVIPFAVNEVTSIGLDLLLTAIAHGTARLFVLTGPHYRGHSQALVNSAEEANAILDGLGYGSERVVVLDEADPSRLGMALRQPAAPAVEPPAVYRVIGRRRETLWLALGHLHARAPTPVDMLSLADGSSFGAVVLDEDKCTLCLSCVGVCPTAALGSNADQPMLSFHESSCVQCDLCRVTCPENAIALEPRVVFGPARTERRVLKVEEPFPCIRCGKPFGTRSTILRMLERLKGHPMFQDPGRLDLLSMCESCRVIAQAEHDTGGGLAGKPRPLPRTSDDYLKERGRAKEGPDSSGE